ncbi:hypothetical protein FE263_13805 [Lichenicoccus roseus]|uniref:Glycosyl hydrolase family 30 beta sandwich domain-containing protein n=2 Tax=Lichenicoccus roseus TaxID=2683649 RepID=A0A5R9J3I8_9PROT|nr:hypothetical protein FE263_13805 [Lichenicoccus roseus]
MRRYSLFNTLYVNATAAADMKYLGISHVRDLAPGNDPASFAPYAALAGLAYASGSLPAPALTPTLANLPVTARTVLMEKPDGSLWLAIWNESATSPTTVSIYLGNVTSDASVYDPLTGTAPVSTGSGVTGMTVALGTDPLIVSIQPE